MSRPFLPLRRYRQRIERGVAAATTLRRHRERPNARPDGCRRTFYGFAATTLQGARPVKVGLSRTKWPKTREAAPVLSLAVSEPDQVAHVSGDKHHASAEITIYDAMRLVPISAG